MTGTSAVLRAKDRTYHPRFTRRQEAAAVRRATTGDDAGERDGALGLPKGQHAPNGRGLRVPQAATPARLFPRFRRLKRSSAATHMPTVGRPGERRAHERLWEKWGLAVGDLLKVLLLPSCQATRRVQDDTALFVVCCVACLVCLVGRAGKRWAFFVPSLTGTGQCRLAAGEGWCVGVGDEGPASSPVSEKSMWTLQALLPRAQVGRMWWRTRRRSISSK